MKFVLADDLNRDMRLAKPLFNKNGVLLFDRGATLTDPVIRNIKNFNLLGVYILEPAEPLPPISAEDIEFERLQTMYIFRLREVMVNILSQKPIDNINAFIDDIIRHFGKLDHRVNFNQNLRSSDDFVYKHAISVAILVTMMSSHLGISYENQRILIASALLYNIGYLYIPKNILAKGKNINEEEQEVVDNAMQKGADILLGHYGMTFNYFANVNMLIQSMLNHPDGNVIFVPDDETNCLLHLLSIANQFDLKTAMNIDHEPESEIVAIQELYSEPEKFPVDMVNALADSIHIVPAASTVDFTDGTSGIVLLENQDDFMMPVVLSFDDHKVYDLSNPAHQREKQIKDIMKTMDNRIHTDKDTIKQFMADDALSEQLSKLKHRLGN